ARRVHRVADPGGGDGRQPVVVAGWGSDGMSIALPRLRGRDRERVRARAERRVTCPNDRFAFAPRFTEGTCPLCGWKPKEAVAAPPLLARVDRFWLAVGLWGAASLLMLVLVVLAYVRG